MITSESLDLLTPDELQVMWLVVTYKNYRKIFAEHVNISQDKFIWTVKSICTKLLIYPTRAQALRSAWNASIAYNIMQRRAEKEQGIVHEEPILKLPVGNTIQITISE